MHKKHEYATRWVITTENDTFLTLKTLSELRTDQVIGSGCVVWAVVRYEERHQSPDTRAVQSLVVHFVAVYVHSSRSAGLCAEAVVEV